MRHKYRYESQKRRNNEHVWVLFGFAAVLVAIFSLSSQLSQYLPAVLFLLMLGWLGGKLLAQTLWPRINTEQPLHRLTNLNGDENLSALKFRENAERAIHNANYDQKLPFYLEDIGLLVYEDTDQPLIMRLSEIPSTTTHIRPFIMVERSSQLPGDPITIRFIISDGYDKLQYSNVDTYKMNSRLNFITPSTWLPIKEQTLAGLWTLHVAIGDDKPFAVFAFSWIHKIQNTQIGFTNTVNTN